MINNTKKEKYWFSPKMKWRTFKAIQDKIPKTGIYPMHIDKILWQMLRDKQINIIFDASQKDDPIIITTQNPPKKFIKIK
jgi:N-glycosylase/DNA lyase